MGKIRWQTPIQLRSLLNELVSWKSVTLTEGERRFPYKLRDLLQTVSYFQKYDQYISLHHADKGRKFLTALYKHPKAVNTVCLISHFDTVNTSEYGKVEALATKPDQLTKVWADAAKEFPPEAARDLQSGSFIFGRGTMDMKMGLALHLQLMEKAILNHWPINLLLLTVPDEEVNSSGMRHAVPILLDIQKKYGLEYKLFLNSEPVFSMDGNNDDYFVYTGTIGKILAAALFFGKEAHAGEPLRGLTSSYMASCLTKIMEWNEEFQESQFGEKTPLPITLQQRDIDLQYSTQIPYRSSALYNIFLMKRTPEEVMDLFEKTAKRAAVECNERYRGICEKHGVLPAGEVKVLRYQQLFAYAKNKLGAEEAGKIIAEIHAAGEGDDREKSLRIAERFMFHCQELAPAIIILFAPPYYPAVNCSHHPFIQKCVSKITELAHTKFQLPVKQCHFFNGICDLSYVHGESSQSGWETYEKNSPLWPESYYIPFPEMAALKAPVLNIGPFGKDPHKRTERLAIKNAFEETPVLLEEVIRLTWEEEV